MKAIMFTTMFCIISILTFGQNKDLNRKVFEHVIIKEEMDSTEVKMGDFPIFVRDMITYKEYSNERYSICRITTLSSPSYYLIVIINNKEYTFIDLDEERDFNAIQKIIESFKGSKISKEKMLLYLSNAIELIEYKNKDLIRM